VRKGRGYVYNGRRESRKPSARARASAPLCVKKKRILFSRNRGYKRESGDTQKIKMSKRGKKLKRLRAALHRLERGRGSELRGGANRFLRKLS